MNPEAREREIQRILGIMDKHAVQTFRDCGGEMGIGAPAWKLADTVLHPEHDRKAESE